MQFSGAISVSKKAFEKTKLLLSSPYSSFPPSLVLKASHNVAPTFQHFSLAFILQSQSVPGAHADFFPFPCLCSLPPLPSNTLQTAYNQFSSPIPNASDLSLKIFLILLFKHYFFF